MTCEFVLKFTVVSRKWKRCSEVSFKFMLNSGCSGNRLCHTGASYCPDYQGGKKTNIHLPLVIEKPRTHPTVRVVLEYCIQPLDVRYLNLGRLASIQRLAFFWVIWIHFHGADSLFEASSWKLKSAFFLVLSSVQCCLSISIPQIPLKLWPSQLCRKHATIPAMMGTSHSFH